MGTNYVFFHCHCYKKAKSLSVNKHLGVVTGAKSMEYYAMLKLEHALTSLRLRLNAIPDLHSSDLPIEGWEAGAWLGARMLGFCPCSGRDVGLRMGVLGVRMVRFCF